MGRIYMVPFTATVTAAGGDTDLWELTAADDKPILLRGFSLGQISEVKDAEEEGLRITVKRLLATFTSGSGGVAGVPESPDSAQAAQGFASETNNATVATTSGATDILDEVGWNNRNTPFERWYPDREFCPKVKQGEGLVIRLETTLADDMTFVGNAWIEEE
ncbi:hypothetical protein LCGC14_0907620 [marine sediment metagenome]|uniref:Uncharacterized protein n=1 Tax=marine sediment metagenome TaxID=412755 RepID=A0A0F9NUK2_9ZZZZ